MRRIDVGNEGNARDGLVTLVITVVEILLEALEREAVRRMESGALADEEIERLGRQLATIEAEIDQLKRDEGVEEHVASLKDDLDDLVNAAIRRVDGAESVVGPNDAPVEVGEDE